MPSPPEAFRPVKLIAPLFVANVTEPASPPAAPTASPAVTMEPESDRAPVPVTDAETLPEAVPSTPVDVIVPDELLVRPVAADRVTELPTPPAEAVNAPLTVSVSTLSTAIPNVVPALLVKL